MTGKKRALGRGLDALFGDAEAFVPASAPASAATAAPAATPKAAPQAPENAVLYVGIDEIRPNAMQPRQTFDDEAIDELATSIETYGVIQPVLLKKTELGFELIAGERRWRAARRAGLKAVPALLREVTGEENALIAIIENMQRKDLNPIEEAGAYRNVIDEYGLTQEALARATGKSRSHIANTLRLLKFQDEILEYLRTGVLTLGHANALGAVRDRESQVKFAHRIVKNGLTVREAEKICAESAQTASKPKKPRRNVRKTEDIRRVEEELTSLLGTKVVISGDEESGSVELRYFQRTGLDEIVEFLREAGMDRR